MSRGALPFVPLHRIDAREDLLTPPARPQALRYRLARLRVLVQDVALHLAFLHHRLAGHAFEELRAPSARGRDRLLPGKVSCPPRFRG